LRPEPLLTFLRTPVSAQGFSEAPMGAQSAVDLYIHECADCGLIQHTQRPVEYYKEVIRAVAYSEEMAEFRLSQLREWITDNDLADKAILEIGSGRGEYLDLLKQAGANCPSGIEYSPTSVQECLGRNLDVRQGYPDNELASTLGKTFDAFVIFSFMEHWPDVKGSLRNVRKVIKYGGIGLVEVPNFDYVTKYGMYSEFTTDHIFYFTERTLRQTLEMNGFDVLDIQSVWHDYILSAKVQRREPLATDTFELKRRTVVDSIHRFIDKFASKEVAVWGAGHQALAVLCMDDLFSRVSYVIDSAPFKQGKYTPGSDLLIRPPNCLSDKLPAAVIVMAASYSDEVVRALRLNHPEIKNIAVLRVDHIEEVAIE
jgi:SAM-dependent methyltransferase